MGTNGLIRKGHAKLIQSVDDILDEFPSELWQKGRQGALAMNAATIATLSAEEKMILDAIQGQAPHIDLIAQSAGLPAQNVSAILLSLELKGMVKQAPGKLFVKV
jgi:DNA processing protein